MNRLHWLDISSRVDFKLAVLGFKIVHGIAPAYFSQSARTLIPARQTRSSDAPFLTSDLYLSRSRLLSYGDRSCFYSICKVFNFLPSNVRGIDNFSASKRLTALLGAL